MEGMTAPRTAKELAAYLQTDCFNLRNQLKAANGQIHFNQSTDELSPEQLAVWLPRYLSGRGQFKKEKRELVEALLAKVTTPEKSEPKTEQPEQLQPKESPQPIERQRTNQKQARNWGAILLNLLPILPLPTLGIAASWGVYHFASYFSPKWVAVFEAIGFELVYIGLSTIRDVPDKFRNRLVGVSVGAVFVSVVYNSLSAWLILSPDLFKDLALGWQLIVSVAHGAPIALLGYFVADLISILKNNQRK